jgi:hypothetical protein
VVLHRAVFCSGYGPTGHQQLSALPALNALHGAPPERRHHGCPPAGRCEDGAQRSAGAMRPRARLRSGPGFRGGTREGEPTMPGRATRDDEGAYDAEARG